MDRRRRKNKNASPDDDRPFGTTTLEMADVLRAGAAAYRREYGHRLTVEQNRALREVPCCQTSLFGGHVLKCLDCGHKTPMYNSCQNRSCPKCGGGKRLRWYNDRLKEMLPVEYYHVVFTVPRPIAKLAAANPAVVYNALFHAVKKGTAKTAREWFNATLGFTSILHSWGQLLNLHPHLHCMIPCGGLSRETGRWVDMPSGLFLPKQQMSNDYRDVFLSLLQREYDADNLKLVGDQRHLASPDRFAQWREELAHIQWITYASSLCDDNNNFSLDAMTRTVGYLARYASRVAISNDRLLTMEDGQVSFYYKDYRDDGRVKVKKLPIVTFIHRFLQHVMPNSMRSSRNCGYLANGQRKEALAAIREQLKDRAPVTESPSDDEPESDETEGAEEAVDDRNNCPKCGHDERAITEAMRRPTVNEIYTAPWRSLLEKDVVLPDPSLELPLDPAESDAAFQFF